MPLTLRPIITPSYNAAMFEERQKLARMARKVELGLVSPSTKGMMKPGGMPFPSNSISTNLMSVKLVLTGQIYMYEPFKDCAHMFRKNKTMHCTTL